MASPTSRMTLRDQMSDRRPYKSWPTVDVLEGYREQSLFATADVDLHEVSAGYPRNLVRGPQGVSDNVQTGCKSGLIHQSQQIDACTCKKDL